MKLFDRTSIPTLGRALEAYSLRHKAIAANIANAGTAGYVPKRVRFEEELASSLSAGAAPGAESSTLTGSVTNEHHMPIGRAPDGDVRPSIEDVPGESLASGINSVDIDQEMAELAKNQIRYKFSARLIGDAFRGLQKSIKGTL